MQPHQFSYPEQFRIYQRLNSLVGPGAAAFYSDACRLMEMDIPLKSTTHLVGHLLREIESSLRAVLKPILNQTTNPKDSEKHKSENHKNEIFAALKTLEIAETSAAAEFWLKLPGNKSEDGLHKRAHREDLAPPRIIDQRFRDFWVSMNVLLDEVLDKFETRAASIRKILDKLLTKHEPDNQDINFLRLEVPNSVFALGYFFNRLESPAWLKLLHKAGFFNHPPGLEIDAEGKIFRFPVWAQSRYLIKVAPDEPEAVLEITLQLFDSDSYSNNIRIYEDLAEAVLKMPPELASHWAERAISWLRQQTYLYYRLPDTLGELIAYLADHNKVDIAIKLARELLTVLPQTDDSSLRRPIARFDEYYYDKIINQHLVVLVEQQTNVVLSLFCDLLDHYLSLSYTIEEGRFSEDYSVSWIPNLDDNSENPHQIGSILAGAIWNITKQIAEHDSNQGSNLFQRFKGYHWRIFDRISLHLLRRFLKQVIDLIIDRLTERDRLEWLGLDREGMGVYYSHEHALLLKEQFISLPVEVQQQIFGWLLEEPTNVMQVEAEKREEYVNYWRRDWLSVINNHLPPPLNQLYNHLIQELGAVNSLDSIFANTGSTAWSGPNSPKSGADLAEMAEGEMKELFTYLKEWQPSRNSWRQSRNDLAWELAEQVIAPNPQQFVNQIERFKELDPQFIAWLLRGLKKALGNPPKEESAFSWEPVLTFCAWMHENLRDTQAHPASNYYSEWSRICDAIVEVVDAGLLAKGSSSIPLTLRRQVWQLLEPLTSDLHVTPGFTPHYQGSNMGSYGTSINTVRGKAMHAVMRYAVWTRQDANGDTEASENLEDMREVQQVLECHGVVA